jgi:hypothetical protein
MSMSLSQKDAIVSVLNEDKRLLTAAASQVVQAVRSRYGLSVRGKYVYMIRREYLWGQTRDQKAVREVAHEMTKPNDGQATPLSHLPPEQASMQAISMTLEFLDELMDLAKRMGGLEVVHAVSSKLLSMGFE